MTVVIDRNVVSRVEVPSTIVSVQTTDREVVQVASGQIVVREPSISIVSTTILSSVVVTEKQIEVVTIGTQGPEGPQGPAGSGSGADEDFVIAMAVAL